jgi:predicted CXXCH cytochrome family protein
MLRDKSHIIKIFSVITAFLIVFFIVDRILQPVSYGEHGPYRWNANNENQTLEVINQNSTTCKECHEDIYKLHEKDAHYSVPCVDCHGAGNVHVAFHKSGDSTDAAAKLKAVMPREYKLEGCLYCHRKLKARPTDFPQVNQAEHFKFLHVTDPNTKCIDCHNPHEPIYLLTDLRQSRIHPVVYKCTECHNKTPEKSFKEVADHPAIFECKDCHKEIVKDFSEKPHSKYIDCRTCHLYHKENETTGRIYKNGNAKFCLICHEKKSFKDEKYPPKIEWPAHIGNKNIIAKSDEKICLNCHTDKIHIMNLKPKENPHPDNWKREHKEFAKDKFDICSKCHTQSECAGCHLKNKPLSHVANWPKLHSKAGESNRSSCDFCHKQNSCMNCHKVEVPHPKGFDENHKEVVNAKGKAVCQKCHKEDFCKQCH